MPEIKLTIDGSEYELIPGAKSMFDKSALYILCDWYTIKPKQSTTPDKDWEILSFVDIYTTDDFFTKDMDGLWTNSSFQDPYTETLLIQKRFPIHSVRRNDGEVFTIGDEIKNGKIKKFYIWETQMLIETDRCNSLSLKYQEKVKPKVPLFTTSIDNVEIFKGDKYYSLQKGNGTFNWVKCRYALDKPYEWETAASKEKLNEYILNNKPIEVTLKEIESLLDTCPYDLKGFFKSKINI